MSYRSDITRIIINTLKANLPDFALFFDTHFRLETVTSLIPDITSDGVSFHDETDIVRNELTIDDKMKYYEKDLELWKRMNNVEGEDN